MNKSLEKLVKPPILLVEDDPIATALISTFLKEK
jgi:hypothetical protein